MLSRSTPRTGLAVIAAVLVTAGLITPWTSAAPAAPVTLEAESAALAGGARVETEHVGFTGSGYVGGFTDANRGAARATFTTAGTTSGPHTLTLRYANGTGSARTLTLAVNGGARQVSLPATAGWASWGTTSVSVTLNEGANTIAVSYGSGDSGNVNLDHLALEPAPAAADALEAESAALAGGARVETEHVGFTGSGYVGGFTDANRGTARVTFTATSARAGQGELTLRYANGTGSARTLTLAVNGGARQVSLPATAGWASWGTTSASVTLNAGANTIAVSYGSGDSGNVNLDHLKLTAPTTTTTTTPTTTTTTPPGQSGTYELETGFVAGGATTGSGAVDLPAQGARVVRTVNQTAAGPASVTLRYTNTASAARTVTTYANGVGRQRLSLAAGSGRTTTHTLDLRAGLNLIGYQVDAGDSGGVRLDSIAVTGTAGLAERGATVPYTTYEAESGTTNGTRLAPGRTYTTEAAEASGRSAVRLTGAGQYVQVTLTRPADAITVRASLPDSADGAGTTAPLAVYADGTKVRDLVLTSKYSWVYGDYPFAAAPGGKRPHRFFDDARAVLGRTYPAGTVLRLAKDTAAAAHITVDLVEAEVVGAASARPAGYVDVTDHGARSGDGQDDTPAIRAAISAARSGAVKGVWLPAGTFSVRSLITFSGVDVRGAGIWHTVLQGADRRGGFYVDGGGTTLADFTFDGDVTTRDPDGAPNSDAFLEGEFGAGSTVFNVAVNHTKVGLWVKGANGLYASGLRIRNTMADGVNVNGETTNVRVDQSTLRNTGDDALAMWSWESAGTVRGSVFAFNTVALPVLANGAAIYGGDDNRVEDSLISDTVFNGSGVMVSTWHASKPFGGTTVVQRTTLTRTGSHNWDWNTHTGAVWLFAERADITGAVVLRDLRLDDSSYHGLLLSWQRAIGDLTVSGVRIAGTGGAVDAFADDNGNQVSNAGSNGMHFDRVTGSGRFDGVAVSGVKGSGSQAVVNVDGAFTLHRGTGNSGW